MWIIDLSSAHRIARHALTICLAAGTTFMMSPAQAALNQTTIVVPVRAANQLQLSEVELTFTLNDSTPIELLITGPRGTTRQTRSMLLTEATNDCFDDPTVLPERMACFAEMPTPGAAVNDNVLIIKPRHGSSTSPAIELNKLRILLQFPRVDQAQCTGGITAQERWTIAVVGGGPRILGVTALSFDRKTQSPPACSTGRRVVPASDGPIASFPPGMPSNVTVQ